MDDLAIEMEQVYKSYRGQDALRGLSFTVPRGSVCGFLGRNGAGKTTAIKVLLGMTRADRGAFRVLGRPIDTEAASVAIRARCGYVAENREFYPYMTVEQVIRFTRRFFSGWRSDLEALYLRQFELPPSRKINKLSKGMRAKLSLLLALCRGAELLVLDEPTDGLDPAAVEDVLRILAGLAGESGTTVFFSSHSLAEVEQIADHIAIVEQGRAHLTGSLDEIKASHHHVRLVFAGTVPDQLLDAPCMHGAKREGRTVSLLVRDELDDVLARARSSQATAIDVAPVNLREIFLATVRSE